MKIDNVEKTNAKAFQLINLDKLMIKSSGDRSITIGIIDGQANLTHTDISHHNIKVKSHNNIEEHPIEDYFPQLHHNFGASNDV